MKGKNLLIPFLKRKIIFALRVAIVLSVGCLLTNKLSAQTLNYIPKWGNSPSSSVPSQFYDDGVNVGLSTNLPAQKFDVVGGNIRTDGWYISTVATGTAPLTVNSTSLVSNLNSDMLDGFHYSAFASNAHVHSGMLTNTGTGTATQVAFWNSAAELGGNNSFFWDNVKERLGVGINTPQSKLHVHSTEMVDGGIIIGGGGNLPRSMKDMSDEDSSSKTLISTHINQPYALTTFQITNKITENLSTDGFVISLKDNDAFIALQEMGDIYFSANDQRCLSLFREGKVSIGASTKDAKLNIFSLSGNGLTISSFNNANGYAVQSKVNKPTTKLFEGKFGNTSNFVVFGNGQTGMGIGTPRAMLDIVAPPANSDPLSLIFAGTPTAVNFKVDNAGWCYAREFHVATYSFYDCVFSDDYPLMTLAELETFINKYKHLPDLPSENQVLRDGLDLGNFTGILLKQNEEQYLHLIELNKKVEELQKENKEMKKMMYQIMRTYHK